MDVVKYLREVARKCHLPDTTGDEIARLRAENEILRATLADATRAMAAAPIWHTQHRALSEILIAGRRRLAALDALRPSAPPPDRAGREQSVSAPRAGLAPVGIKATWGGPAFP